MLNRMTVFATAAGLALFACYHPLTARADGGICAKRDRILTYLTRNYREKPVATGLAENGGTIEVLRSRDHATFTIIITMPDGTSCMIAAGKSWESLPTLARATEH